MHRVLSLSTLSIHTTYTRNFVLFVIPVGVLLRPEEADPGLCTRIFLETGATSFLFTSEKILTNTKCYCLEHNHQKQRLSRHTNS